MAGAIVGPCPALKVSPSCATVYPGNLAYGGIALNVVHYALVNPSTGTLGTWTSTTSSPIAGSGQSCVVSGGNIDCVRGSSPSAPGDNVTYCASTTPTPCGILTSSSSSSSSSSTTVASSPMLKTYSVDQSGSNIYGLEVEVFQCSSCTNSANLINSGLTTYKHVFAMSSQVLTVAVDAFFGGCTFNHWQDTGSTTPNRPFTPNTPVTTFTAVYSCVRSTINVMTTHTNGSPLTGYYTTLSQNGTAILSCFSGFPMSPNICSFTVDNGQTYVVTVANYGSELFARWSDNDGSVNSWGGSHVVAVPNSGTSTTISLIGVYSP